MGSEMCIRDRIERCGRETRQTRTQHTFEKSPTKNAERSRRLATPTKSPVSCTRRWGKHASWVVCGRRQCLTPDGLTPNISDERERYYIIWYLVDFNGGTFPGWPRLHDLYISRSGFRCGRRNTCNLIGIYYIGPQRLQVSAVFSNEQATS